MSKQKNPQDKMEFILHWPTISRHGPALECGWHLVTAHWKKLIFISKKTSIANSFLLGVGLCLYFPLSVLGFLPDLNLYRSWAYCPVLCEFIYASVVLCLEDKVPLEWYLTSSSSASSFTQTPVLERKDLMTTSQLGLSSLKSLTLWTLSIGLCFKSNLLKENSLMKSERCLKGNEELIGQYQLCKLTR